MNKTQEKWIQWIKQLQAIAQAGLYYGGTEFDKERYQAVRDLSAMMMGDITDLPLETVKDFFCNEDGYQTPKITTRAAVFHDDKILLVKESYGKWTLPGGWAEPGYSVRENTLKEVREEAGITACADYIIALQDKDKHNKRVHPFSEDVVFVHCTALDGHFEKNLETVEMKFFAREELPDLELSTDKTSLEQLELAFRAHSSCPGNPEKTGLHWETILD